MTRVKHHCVHYWQPTNGKVQGKKELMWNCNVTLWLPPWLNPFFIAPLGHRPRGSTSDYCISVMSPFLYPGRRGQAHMTKGVRKDKKLVALRSSFLRSSNCIADPATNSAIENGSRVITWIDQIARHLLSVTSNLRRPFLRYLLVVCMRATNPAESFCRLIASPT